MNNFTTCITRFAPSPTGKLHLGGVRTALFNWLWARHNQGKFLIRMEDTDRQRSTTAFADNIVASLSWLGMNSDSEIVWQSARQQLYQEQIHKLHEHGAVYKCTCSAERLEALREEQRAHGKKPKYDGHCRNKDIHQTNQPFVLRFKNPQDGMVVIEDAVRGTVSVHNDELDDFIIQRSDGSPTYNFCVVVDDAQMQITHVIRGEDHLNNTPKQINLYNALGYPVPQFAHLSMIHGESGKKLSKRDGAMSVLEYKEAGLFPEALLNYLARLGFSHGNQEIFTLDELIRYFDIHALTKSAAVFNPDKLTWTNQQHMAQMNQTDLWHRVRHLLPDDAPKWLVQLLVLYQKKCSNLVQLADELTRFVAPVSHNDEMYKKWLDDAGRKNIKAVQTALMHLNTWNTDSINQCLKDVVESQGIKFMQLGKPLRVALIDTDCSPSIADIVAAVPKEWVLGRLQEVV